MILAVMRNEQSESPASLWLKKIDVIMNTTDQFNCPLYNPKPAVFKTLLFIIAASFQHPCETVASPDKEAAVARRARLLEALQLGKEKRALFCGGNGNSGDGGGDGLAKMQAPLSEDEFFSYAKTAEGKPTDAVDTLPYGRHLTNNESILYLVRAVLEALWKGVVKPRLDAVASDDLLKVTEVDRSTTDLEKRATVDLLFDEVIKQLQAQRSLSSDEYDEMYASSTKQFGGKAARTHNTIACMQKKWAAVRYEMYEEIHSKEVMEIMEMPATLIFMNVLFPSYY
jgi:hypothetical protein